jgi:hypothetical protein
VLVKMESVKSSSPVQSSKENPLENKEEDDDLFFDASNGPEDYVSSGASMYCSLLFLLKRNSEVFYSLKSDAPDFWDCILKSSSCSGWCPELLHRLVLRSQTLRSIADLCLSFSCNIKLGTESYEKYVGAHFTADKPELLHQNDYALTKKLKFEYFHKFENAIHPKTPGLYSYNMLSFLTHKLPEMATKSVFLDFVCNYCADVIQQVEVDIFKVLDSVQYRIGNDVNYRTLHGIYNDERFPMNEDVIVLPILNHTYSQSHSHFLKFTKSAYVDLVI